MNDTYTMTGRNPDIMHNEDSPIPDSLIPSGCYIHYGKLLPDRARSCKPPVPFGTAKKRTYRGDTKESRHETVGLVIRMEDRKRFTLAIANKNAKKKRMTNA
jgi:hypothetical protein